MMATIFEYGNQIDISDRPGLETYLHSIWKDFKYLWPSKEIDPLKINPNFQPFLSFDGNAAKANNFIGFINYESTHLEIYPKIFKNEKPIDKDLMHRHLFYWLTYCKKIKFPFNRSFLDGITILEFPELIIYLMACQINETVSTQQYSTYEEVQESLATPRGQIDFKRYTNQLSYGIFHQVDCNYEPFVYDNTLNRIIKYCTRLLLSKTRLLETQRILNETIFILDEVEDQACSVSQLNRIKLSRLYYAHEELIQVCRMILENQIYSHVQYELNNWCLLLPMEYVFEDFLYGFIKQHFSDKFFVEPKKSDLYLQDSPPAFNLEHDILVTNKTTGQAIIIDTKYKPRWEYDASDPKKGVSQEDMYQMLSYAYKRGTNKIILIYPNTSDNLASDFTFKIKKAGSNEIILIKVVDVSFWSSSGHRKIDNLLIQKINSLLTSEF